jgi:hypothetical protein
MVPLASVDAASIAPFVGTSKSELGIQSGGPRPTGVAAVSLFDGQVRRQNPVFYGMVGGLAAFHSVFGW